MHGDPGSLGLASDENKVQSFFSWLYIKNMIV